MAKGKRSKASSAARSRYKSEGRARKNKQRKLEKRIFHLVALKERADKNNKYNKLHKAIAEVQAKLDKLGG